MTLETVLDDKDGMHLGAGPFLLIYSRSVSEPLISEWPNVVKVSRGPSGTLGEAASWTDFTRYFQIGAKADSMELLRKLPPAIQETAYNPSAHVTLDPEPSPTLPHTNPVYAPVGESSIPLVPNRGPSS